MVTLKTLVKPPKGNGKQAKRWILNFKKFERHLKSALRKEEFERLKFIYEGLNKSNKRYFCCVCKKPKKKTFTHKHKYYCRKCYLKEYFGLTQKQYFSLIRSGCSRCGSSKNIHLHHIIHKSCGGSNELSNLTPLCYNCHTEEHPFMKNTK